MKNEAGESQPRLNLSTVGETGRASGLSSLSIALKNVVRHVKKDFGISYSVRGLAHLLHRQGYVCKKPKMIPGKADPEAQKEFVAQYQELKKNQTQKDPI